MKLKEFNQKNIEKFDHAGVECTCGGNFRYYDEEISIGAIPVVCDKCFKQDVKYDK